MEVSNRQIVVTPSGQRVDLATYLQALNQELERFRTWVEPGHFYSPIPSLARIQQREDLIFAPAPSELIGLDLNPEGQVMLVNALKAYYSEHPYAEAPRPGVRYFYPNEMFSMGDALALYCMLRHFKPKRVIEVGSGFSSAVILDTNELFFDDQIVCTFIEPYPDRLLGLLRPDEPADVTLYQQEVQDVPLEIYGELEENDVLFIDSSHVSKIDSDVNHLIFNVLPLLRPGTLIHFHDIFHPFEYPKAWIYEGRAWNEGYLLRAFLTNNPHYRVRLFNSYLHQFYREEVVADMPAWTFGGSLWLQKLA